MGGRIYDRNEDADLDITDLTEEAARLYQRKQAAYSENRVYPMIQPDSLRADLIDRCRRHIRINGKNHLVPTCSCAKSTLTATMIGIWLSPISSTVTTEFSPSYTSTCPIHFIWKELNVAACEIISFGKLTVPTNSAPVCAK